MKRMEYPKNVFSRKILERESQRQRLFIKTDSSNLPGWDSAAQKFGFTSIQCFNHSVTVYDQGEGEHILGHR